MQWQLIISKQVRATQPLFALPSYVFREKTMNDLERLKFLWQAGLPLTATEIAIVTGLHRSSVYRQLAPLTPARVNPKRWLPRDAERIIFHGEEARYE